MHRNSFGFIFFVAFNCLASATELLVPTPSIPSTVHPVKHSDIFTSNLIVQIHRRLFSEGASGVPTPDLVEDFELSKTSTVLRLKLKPVKFHDGTKLSANHVKSSLEFAIENKFPGYKRLSCIEGFEDFVENKTKHIQGIQTTNNKSLKMTFSCKAPKIIHVLTDLRLSVLKDPRSPKIGLGPYKFFSKSKKQLRLLSDNPKLTFQKIQYTLANEQEATSLINNNDLSVILNLLPLRKKEPQNPISGNKNYIEAYSLKNYLIAINSKKFNSLQKRSMLFKLIDRAKLISSCYPGELKNDNIVPPGTSGYSPEIKFNEDQGPKSNGLSVKRVEIAILSGIGSESCIKNFLNKTLSKASIRSSIRIMETNQAINKWNSGQIDIMVLYMATEPSLDMLHFYTAKKGFHLGPKADDSESVKIQSELNHAPNLENYESIARKLHQKILDLKTVLPLFIPKERIYFSKHIKPNFSGVTSPIYVKYSEL